jgi:hypothetical protein
VLTEALRRTHRVAVGTFTWRGKTTPIAIRVHQDGLLLQRLYFAYEVHNAAEIDRGAEPKIRDQERTLAERLISELSATEFHPENYEDEYRKRVLKAIEQKVGGSGDRAPRGRGAAGNNRPGRDAQGEPRTEGTGEGGSYQSGSEDRVREAASPPASRVVDCPRLIKRKSPSPGRALLILSDLTTLPNLLSPTRLPSSAARGASE